MTSRRRPASSHAASKTVEAERPKLKTLAQRMREGVLDALGLDDKPARRKPRIESLEPRVYMSASPAPVMVGDRLHIELGQGDDQVVIEQLAPGSGGAADLRVRLTLDGQASSFDFSGVRSIEADGGSGNDTIELFGLAGGSSVLESVTYQALGEGQGQVEQQFTAGGSLFDIDYAGIEHLVDHSAAKQRVFVNSDGIDDENPGSGESGGNGQATRGAEDWTVSRLQAGSETLLSLARSLSGTSTGAGHTLIDVVLPVDSLSFDHDPSQFMKLSFDDVGAIGAAVTAKAGSVEVQGVLLTQGHNLDITAVRDITLDADAVVSTRALNLQSTTSGGDTFAGNAGAFVLNAASTGNSGAVVLTGLDITLQAGAKLLSHVETNSGHAAGDITLTARLAADVGNAAFDYIGAVDPSITVGSKAAGNTLQTDVKGAKVSLLGQATSDQAPVFGLNQFGGKNRVVDISLGKAAISGSSVSIVAEARDVNLLSRDLPVFSTYASELFVLPIPLGLQVRYATATVSLSDSSVVSSGNVTIGTTTVVDGTVTALAAGTRVGLGGFSASASVVNGTAQTTLEGTTSVQGGGNVKVQSDVTTIASALSRGTANLPSVASLVKPANAWSVGATVAITKSNTAAHTTLGEHASISAGGNVDFSAKGDLTNKAKADVAVYTDGLAGIGIVASFDDSDIRAQVDGSISAGGSAVGKAISLAEVNNTGNTLHLVNHGFNYGEQVVYMAQATEDAGAAKLQAIGGLVDGHTYTVLVIDEDNFQLADAGGLVIDAAGVSADSQQSLTPRRMLSFDAAQATVDTDDDTITLASAHGWASGQRVDYLAASQADAIGGLVSGASYEVVRVSDRAFQLKDSSGAVLHLTSGGSSAQAFGYNVESARIDFNAGATGVVSAADRTITFDSAHGLATGDAVVYQVDDTVANTSTIKRGASFFVSPQVVEFDPGATIDGQATVNLGSNTIVLPSAGMPFVTGQRVSYSSGALSSIGGLTNQADYFVIVTGDQTIQLSSSRALALAGQGVVDLTSTGAAGLHRLTAKGVDAADNIVAAPGHGLETGQQITYRAGGAANAIAGLTDGSTLYAIARSGDLLQVASSRANALAGIALDIGEAGGGTTQSFESTTIVQKIAAARQLPVVDLGADTIEITAHGFTANQEVVYRTSGGAPIGGLQDGTHYFVITGGLDANHVKLATTAQNAQQGIAINLAAGATLGAADHALEPLTDTDPVRLFDATALKVVDEGADSLYQYGHGYKTGDRVTYLNTGGAAIGGLVAGQDYFVVRIDDNHFALASSEADAQATTPVLVNLGGGATGSGHGFERASLATVGDTPINGLDDGEVYFVTVVDDHTIRLSASESDARAAVAKNLNTATATGTTHVIKGVDSRSGVNVTAELKAKNFVSSQSSVGSAPTIKDILTKPELGFSMFAGTGRSTLLSIINPTGNTKDILKGTFQSGSGSSPITVAAGVAYNQVNHAVSATLGATAHVTSGQDVKVATSLKELAQVFAQGNASPDRGKKGFVGGLAVAVANYTNTSDALIAGGAVVDARRNVTVDAQLHYPSLLSEYDYNARGIVEFLSGRAGLDKFSNIMALSKAQYGNTKIAAAGSVAVATYDNRAHAEIGDGAMVNQALSAATDPAASVTVQARTEMDMVNAAGVLSLKLDESGLRKDLFSGSDFKPRPRGGLFSSFGTEAEYGTLGGSFVSQSLDNVTTALVSGGAKVHTANGGKLTVDADEVLNSLEIAHAGGRAGVIGAAGAVPWLNHDSRTLAQVGSGVDLRVGGLEVTADSDAHHTMYAGAVQMAGVLGLGVSAGIANVNRDVQALIGERQRVIRPADVNAATGAITLDQHGLNTGDEVIYRSPAMADRAMSSATAASPAIGGLTDGQHYYVIKVDDQHIRLASSAANAQAGTSVALTAPPAGSFHTLERAGSLPQTEVSTVSTASLHAQATGEIINLALAGALPSPAKPPQSVEDVIDAIQLNQVVLAGSAAVNNLADAARAYVNTTPASRLRTGGAIDIEATNDTSVRAGTGAAAVTIEVKALNQMALAGAVSINRVDSLTDAFVAGGTINADLARDLTLQATRGGQIYTGAASLAGALNGALAPVAAASVSINQVNDWTHTYLSGTQVNAVALSLTAKNDADIKAGGGALGGSRAAVAAAFGASVALNTVNAEVGSWVLGSKVSASSTLTSQALLNTQVGAYGFGFAGAFALGGGTVAVSGGGAGADNQLQAWVQAGLRSSDVDAAGDIELLAQDASDVEAIAVGAAVAVQAGSPGLAAGVGASHASNTERNLVQVSVEGVGAQGRGVQAGGKLELTAQTVGAAIEATSVAVAIAANASGVSLAGGGSNAVNTVDNRVRAFVGKQAIAKGAGGVEVKAKDKTVATTMVPDVAIAVSNPDPRAGVAVAVGVSLSSNTLSSQVEAYADHAQLSSSGGAVEVDARSERTASATNASVAISTTLGLAVARGESNIAGHTKAWLGAQADVLADTVKVTALLDAEAKVDVHGGGAALLAVDAMLGTAVVNSAVLAAVEDAASVSAKHLAVRTQVTDPSGNDVPTSRRAVANVVVGTVSIVGGNGGKASATVMGDVEARIGSATVNLASGGSLEVDATSTNFVDAHMPGGGAGAVPVSAMTAESTLSGSTRASLGGTLDAALGQVTVGASTNNTTNADVLAASIGLAGGAGGRAAATQNSRTEALVRDGASLQRVGALGVTAQAQNTVTTDARGGAGGGVAIGGFEAVSTLASLNDAQGRAIGVHAGIGKVAGLNAQTVQVGAGADQDVRANLLTLGVGLLAGSGGRAQALSTGNVLADIVSDGARMTVGGGTSADSAVQVFATSSEKTSAVADGGSGGGISASALFADARSHGNTQASLQADLDAAGVDVLATASRRDVDASITVGGVALGSGVGGRSEALADGNIAADLGRSVHAVGRDVTVKALDERSTVDAVAKGGAGGAVAVSGFVSKATLKGATTATVKNGADLSTHHFTLDAEARDGQASGQMTTLGLGIGAGSGGSANALLDTRTKAVFGEGTTTTLNATGQVLIQAKADQAAKTDVDAVSGGGLAVGSVNTTLEVSRVTSTSLGADAVVNAGGGYSQLAQSRLAADADASCQAGALIPVALSGAAVKVNDLVDTAVGDRAKVHAGGDVLVEATQSLDIGSSAFAQAIGLGGGNAGASGAVTQVDPANAQATAAVRVRIGTQAEIAGTQVVVSALQDKLDVDVTGQAAPGGVATTGSASLTLNSTASTTVAANAQITARAGLTVGAYHDSFDARVDAQGFGLFAVPVGGSTSVAVHLVTETEVAAGATLKSGSTIALDAAASRPLLSVNGGAGNLSDARNLKVAGTLITPVAPNPVLEVDAAGNIVRAENVSASVDAAARTVHVAAIAANASTQKSVLFRFNPTDSNGQSTSTSGSGTTTSFTGKAIVKHGGYTAVDLLNNSNYTLVLDGMNLTPTNDQAVDKVSFDDGLSHAGDYETSLDASATTPAVTVSNLGSGALRLEGAIYNPNGDVALASGAGGIVSASSQARVTGRSVDLQAAGAVGSASAKLLVHTQALAARAGTGMAIDNSRADLVVDRLSSTAGEIRLKTAGSLSGKAGATDFSAPSVWLESSSGSLGSSAAALQLNTAFFGGNAQTDIHVQQAGGSLALGTLSAGSGSIDVNLADTPDVGRDLLTLGAAASLSAGGDITLQAGDGIRAVLGSQVIAGGRITLAADAASGTDPDTAGAVVDLQGSLTADSVLVRTGAGADDLTLRSVQSATELDAGAGNDDITIGGGRLDRVSAALAIDAGAGQDRIAFDDSEQASGKQGSLRAGSAQAALAGLGTAEGITFAGAEELGLALGSGNDELEVTEIGTGIGATLNLGGGADTLRLGNLAGAAGQGLAGLQGALAIDAGAQGTGTADALIVSAARVVNGQDVVLDGVLADSLLSGLGLGAQGLTFAGFESVDLSLGAAADHLAITGVAASTRTTVHAGAGHDSIEVGSLAQGSSLTAIAADLVLDAGAGGADLAVRSGAAADLTLARVAPTQGRITQAQATGSITYGGFDTLSVALGDGNDRVTVQDTVATLSLATGAGRDEVSVESVSNLTDVDLGSGADTITVKAATQALAVHGGSLDSDELVVDVSAHATGDDAVLTGSGSGGALSGLTAATISFDKLSQLSLNLGQGNDHLEIDEALDDTAVSVLGGAGADQFDVRRIGGKLTSLTGQTGADQVTVFIAGRPVAGAFAQLGLGVETLKVDNSSNTHAEAWTVSDGDSIDALVGSGGSRAAVIAAAGAQNFVILGGTAADTLTVESNASSAVSGVIDGNSVSLNTARAVLVPGSFTRLPAAEGVIDFDGLLNGSASYDEDGFRLQAGGAGLARDDRLGPAARVDVGRTATLSSSSGGLALSGLRLASDVAGAPVTVTITGTTINGKTVVATVVLPAKGSANALPVFQDASSASVFSDPAFALLQSVSFSGNGAFLLDNIAAQAIQSGASAAQAATSLATITLGLNGRDDLGNVANILLDTRTPGAAAVVIDRNRNGVADGNEPRYTASTDLSSAVPFTTRESGGVVEFDFLGNLVFGAGTSASHRQISALGSSAVRLVANNISIGQFVDFNFSAVNATAGPGGGAGANTAGQSAGGAGSGGSVANTTIIGGGSNGEGGDNGSGSSNGSAGGDGRTPQDGMSIGAPLSNPGTNGTAGTGGNAGSLGLNNGSGAAGTGGTGGGNGGGGAAGTPGANGVGGGGGGGRSLFNQGNGGAGINGTPGVVGNTGNAGNPGAAGNPGTGGSNVLTGSDLNALSGGSGGGSGGAGGGGGGGGAGGYGGAGGGGGGGGSGYSGTTIYPGGDGGDGGRGGQGGAGGNGTGGAGGGAGGGGGGALELRALGQIVAGSSVTFAAAGGNGSAGGTSSSGVGGGSSGETAPGQRTGLFGSGWQTGNPGSSGIGGNGGTGGTGANGGHGGAGGRGGNGGGGGGGAGGTIKLAASVLDLAGTSINVGGGAGANGATGGGGGRVIQTTNEPTGSGATTTGAQNVRDGSDERATVNPYVKQTGGSLSTPYLADVQGRADSFGLLDGVSKSNLSFAAVASNGVTGSSTIPDANKNALAAVIRVPADSLRLATDAYDGYDLLVFVNLSDTMALGNPQLGVAANSLTPDLKALQVYAATGAGDLNAVLGGQAIDHASADYKNLGALDAGKVWATLVPKTTPLGMKASVEFAGRTFSVEAGSMTANSVYFINYTAQAGTTAGTDLPALTQMVTSPAADKLVYAISPDSKALVVLNPGDLSERQMLRNGYNGVSGLDGVSSLALSGNGSFVITGSSAANGGLTVFQRDGWGNLSFVATQPHLGQATWTAVATSPAAPQAVFSVGSGGVAKTVLDASGHPTLATTNAAVTGDHIAASQDGRLLYVSDSSHDRLVVLDAATLQELQRFDGALGLDGASAIEVSADDGSVYLACTDGDRLAVFTRSSNGLALVQVVNNLSQGVRGLDGAADLALTPDQRLLLVASAEDNSVAVFARDAASGTLSFLQRLRNGVDGLSGLNSPLSIATSADGSQVYVGAAGTGTQPAGVVTLGNAALGVALPPPAQQRTEFDGIETLNVQLGSGADNLQLLAAPEAGDIEVHIDTGGGDDRVVLADLPRQATVALGSGADRLQLSASRAGTDLTVRAGDGADEIVIERAGAGSRIEAFGGSQADTMRVAGAALPISATVVLHGDETNTAPYDKLVFDPQDANPLNVDPTVPNSNAGTLQAGQRSGGSFTPTAGLVSYDTFESVQVVTGPLIALAPLSTSEGQGLTLSASIRLLGGATSLSAPLAWDVDGDGDYDDAFGNNLTLSWTDLRRLGITDSGRRSIGVRATSADGVSHASTSLDIADTRPTVLLQGGGTAQVGAPYEVSFNSFDDGDDSVTGWYLDWGDGSAIEEPGSNLRSARHVYAEPGSYTVRIGAEDQDTAGSPTWSDAVPVTVSVARSQVQAGGPYQGFEGASLTLSATAVGTPASWSWDLDGDGGFDDAVGQTISLTPADEGSFAASVRVTYADGSVVDSYATPVTVLNRAPTAEALVNGGPVDEGSAVSVGFVGATDASSADLADGLLYSFDVDNDGSFEVTNATTPTVTLDGAWFKQAGVVTVRGRVADHDGGYTELLTRVTVREVAPTLAASGSGTAVEGEDYALALSAHDPGADTVSRWIVDWADGSVESFAADAGGAPQVLSHRFSDNGSYVVRITAIDQDGAYATTHAVEVANAAPGLQLAAIGTPLEGQAMRLAGLISEPGALDHFSLDVDWGDGQTERITLGASVRGFEISHVYADDGDYVVRAAIADDDGGTGTSTLDVQVANQAPRIQGMGPDGPQVQEGSLVTVTGQLADSGLLDSHEVSLAWGDGSTSLASIDALTRQWTATHRYLDDDLTGSNNDLTDRDTFSVVATVSDEDGGQSSASTEVTVLNVFPTVTNVEFTETLTDTGLDVVIRGTFTDPGTLDVHGMLVDWGDLGTPPEGSFFGNFVPVEVDEAGHSFELTHHYADGSIGYQITTIFTDDDGAFFAIFGGYGKKVFTTAAFPVNHAPVAGDDSYVALPDTELELDLKANDSDPDGDATSLLVLTAPSHGTLRAVADGRFVYRPDAGFTGDDSFTYRLSDGQAGSNLATVSIRTRNPSYATDDAVALDEDGTAVFDVRANDVEVNTATVVTGPAHGSVVQRADGSFVYTPHADYNGADSFTYRSDDPYGIRTEAVVAITVRPVNDAPVVSAIADIDILEGRSTSLQVQAADVDHDALSYSVTGAGASIDAQGRLSFAADDGNAVRNVTVSVSDGQVATQRSFNVRIANVAPTLVVTGAASVQGGQPYTLQLASSDPGRDTITKWVIDWGDGRIDTLAGNPSQASHTYARAGGNFAVRATATDEDGSYAATPVNVAVQPDLLKVSSMTGTATGVRVRFDHIIDTTAIGLWFPTSGKADVQLKGDTTGIVSGSIVLDEDGKGFTFIRTGGVLASDSYTLTLASGAAGFHDAAGGLDGNGDGRGGDDYVARFDFRPAKGTAVIGLPDFMRGPGQPVNVPALGLGVPVTYTTGTAGLHQIVFTVDYDTRMLNITGARATLGLPLGTTITFETVSTGLNAQQARITVTLPGKLTLPAGSFQLASLVTSVPAGAPYGASEVLRIKVASLNGSAPASGSVLSDDALHVVGYFGDANGDAAYTSADVQQILRVVNRTDPGFAAWRNVDPVSIAGVTGGTGLSALDANSLLLNIGLPIVPRLGSINFYAGPATAPATASATLVPTSKVAAAASAPMETASVMAVATQAVATEKAAARVVSAEPAASAVALPRIDLASPVGRVCDALSFGHTRVDSAWLQQTLGNGGESRRIEPNARLRISVPGVGRGLR